MSIKVIERWLPSNLDELEEALEDIKSEVGRRCHSPHAVYVDVLYIELQERLLSDGFHALDIVIKENR